MLPRRIAITAVTAACAALLASATAATAAPFVDGHFPMPEFDGSNNKIAAGPDGNMWMGVNEGEFDVARISPAGAVDKFKLQDLEHPAGITAGPEGRIWVTDTNKVGSFLPSDPEGTRQVFTILTVTAKTPIVFGPENQMWVAASDNVVHFSPSDPENTDQPISVPGLQPKDIDVAGSLLVVADSNNSRIVTVTPGGAVDEIPLLGDTTTSQGVAGSPSGQIAFSKSDGTTEGLGLVTPPAAPTAVEMPGDPFGVALGSDGAFWFAMSAADNLQRLTPEGTAAPLNGFPEKFFPRQIASGPNNTLWVTMEIPGGETYEVAKVSGLEPPKESTDGTKPAAAPETKISKGPKKKVKTKGKKAKVAFKFSSSTAGAKFECALVKVKKGKKQPKPKFKGCKSPKKYKLKPGKYRFSVRAVVSGVADPSPATKTFKVVHVRG
jgi:streptogramin lyase